MTPEEKRAYKRKYYEANREELLAKQRAKYHTDEYRDARNAKYRAAHTQPVSEHGEKMRRYFEHNDREKRAAKREIKAAEERAKNDEIIARKINPKSSTKVAVIKREIRITSADIAALNEDYEYNKPLHA